MDADATSRQIILDAAVTAFASKGYAGASIQDILRTTKLSRPTLYYYFQSKAGLFRAIFDFAFDESFRLMQAAVARETSCAARLVAVAAAHFEFAEKHRNLTRLVLSATFAAPGELPPEGLDFSKRQRNFEFVEKLVRAGQNAGELVAEFTAAEVAQGVYGAISFQIRLHLLKPGAPLDAPRARRIVSLFLEGAGRKH